MTRASLALIWAQSENGIIGHDGDLPWSLPDDLAHFKRLTKGHPVIMGRKTWDSLYVQPLPGRHNIVVTRNRDFQTEGATVVESPESALREAGGESAFCIGGSQLFALMLPLATRLELTIVHTAIEGDTHAPDVDWSEWALTDEHFHPVDDRHNHPFTFQTYDRI